MSPQQLDLLAGFEAEAERAAESLRRRAGDFTWAGSVERDASCARCRRAGSIPLLRVKCAIHQPVAPDDKRCLTQFISDALGEAL